jgi:hypothetical protein
MRVNPRLAVILSGFPIAMAAQNCMTTNHTGFGTAPVTLSPGQVACPALFNQAGDDRAPKRTSVYLVGLQQLPNAIAGELADQQYLSSPAKDRPSTSGQARQYGALTQLLLPSAFARIEERDRWNRQVGSAAASAPGKAPSDNLNHHLVGAIAASIRGTTLWMRGAGQTGCAGACSPMPPNDCSKSNGDYGGQTSCTSRPSNFCQCAQQVCEVQTCDGFVVGCPLPPPGLPDRYIDQCTSVACRYNTCGCRE